MTKGKESIVELPENARRYIAQVVCGMKCSHRIQREVERELIDHFHDALHAHDLETDEERTAVAHSLIAGFGDELLLAELLRRGKRRCRPEQWSVWVGAGIVFAILMGAILLGSPLGIFINIPSAAVVILLPGAMACTTYGCHPLLQVFIAAVSQILGRENDHIVPEAPGMLQTIAMYSYAGAAIGSLVGIVQIGIYLDNPEVVGPGLAVLMLCPLYALLLAEGVYRPMAARLAHLASLEGKQAAQNHLKNEGVGS